MDVLIALILSVVTPWYASSHQTDYSSHLGFLLADTQLFESFQSTKTSNILKEAKSTSQKTKPKTYKTKYTEDSEDKQFYELRIYSDIYFLNNRIILSPTSSWSPKKRTIEVTTYRLNNKNVESPSGSPVSFTFKENPSIGLYFKVNMPLYHLRNYLRPFVGVSTRKLGYYTTDNFQNSLLYSPFHKLHAGLEFYDTKGYTLMFEFSYGAMNIIGVPDTNINPKINDFSFKLGGFFQIASNIEKFTEHNKKDTYKDILQELNQENLEIEGRPSAKKRKEIKKALSQDFSVNPEDATDDKDDFDLKNDFDDNEEELVEEEEANVFEEIEDTIESESNQSNNQGGSDWFFID